MPQVIGILMGIGTVLYMTPEATTKQPSHTLLQGDALQLLSSLPEESIHAVVTDPPYGLTANLDIEALLANWLAGETFISDQNGYGGADWDNSVPGPELWREVHRLLVPGGYVLAFAAARTIDLTTLALRLAGFQIRDLIHWVYAPGRASRDQGKVAAELGDVDLARSASGWRPTFQPGHEPIIVARKAFDEPGVTVLDSMCDFGVGAINHSAVSRANGSIATNVWVVHDVWCSPTACCCEVNQLAASSHGTHVYPAQLSSGHSLNVAKPGKAERPVAPDGTRHLTVKPLALMRTLIASVTQPNHVVLDPFLGSGTTMEAALLEGRQAVGCELNSEYIPLIKQRLQRCRAR
jgi:site-specific DNA-methyltransferase (adenine-specific)